MSPWRIFDKKNPAPLLVLLYSGILIAVMSNACTKPSQTASQLIQKMKNEKGITFRYISEADAERYLLDINNYLRTASYRKNYQKYMNGSKKGTYIRLDFAYLKELSTLDFHFRRTVVQMCLAIEHDIKITMLKYMEQTHTADSYKIVEDFINNNPYILKKLEAAVYSPFTADLFQKYFTVQSVFNPNTNKNENKIVAYDDCPLWVFFEFITFGDLLKLYRFFYSLNQTRPPISEKLLNIIKSLRNACAHNNCVLANMKPRTSSVPPEISQYVARIKTISASQRQKKLTCRPILEFVALLYVYKKIVSTNIQAHGMSEIKELFFKRFPRNWRYFISNDLLKSNYLFTREILKSI